MLLTVYKTELTEELSFRTRIKTIENWKKKIFSKSFEQEYTVNKSNKQNANTHSYKIIRTLIVFLLLLLIRFQVWKKHYYNRLKWQKTECKSFKYFIDSHITFEFECCVLRCFIWFALLCFVVGHCVYLTNNK